MLIIIIKEQERDGYTVEKYYLTLNNVYRNCWAALLSTTMCISNLNLISYIALIDNSRVFFSDSHSIGASLRGCGCTEPFTTLAISTNATTFFKHQQRHQEETTATQNKKQYFFLKLSIATRESRINNYRSL